MWYETKSLCKSMSTLVIVLLVPNNELIWIIYVVPLISTIKFFDYYYEETCMYKSSMITRSQYSKGCVVLLGHAVLWQLGRKWSKS